MSLDSSELLGFLRSRRSIRAYSGQPVPRGVVEESVRAALFAPRAGNARHWRIIALSDKAFLSGMAEAVEAEIARQRAAISSPRALQGFDGYTAFFTHFREAPLVLVLIAKPYDSIYMRIASRYLGDAEQSMGEMAEPAVISAAMAAENLMLALHAHGVGTCYLTGPLIVQREIEKRLGVSEPEHVVGLIAAGYPAAGCSPVEEAKRRTESVSDVLEWR